MSLRSTAHNSTVYGPTIRVYSRPFAGYNFRVLTIPKTMQAVVYRGPNDLRLES
jgi:hypothetical protein